MGAIRLLAAPIRRIVHFPLFQLAVVVLIILLLQAANDNSVLGRIYQVLDNAVGASVRFSAELFEVKSFTSAGLVWAFGIAYVYLVCLLFLVLLRFTITRLIDLLGWSNAFGLRNAIARERGIAAYRAWVPFERIRPKEIPQQKWEEAFAWPADNRPPYPPLPVRMARAALSYVVVFGGAAVLLQVFTPFPVITWLEKLANMLVG